MWLRFSSRRGSRWGWRSSRWGWRSAGRPVVYHGILSYAAVSRPAQLPAPGGVVGGAGRLVGGAGARLTDRRYTMVYCRTLRCPAERWPYERRPAVRAAPGGTSSARRYARRPAVYYRTLRCPAERWPYRKKLKFFSRRAFNFGPPGPILNVRRYRTAPPPLGRLTQRPNGQKEKTYG